MERAAQHATEEKALRLPAQLCRMGVRAQSALHVAEEKVTKVLEQLAARGLTVDQVGVVLELSSLTFKCMVFVRNVSSQSGSHEFQCRNGNSNAQTSCRNCCCLAED